MDHPAINRSGHAGKIRSRVAALPQFLLLPGEENRGKVFTDRRRAFYISPSQSSMIIAYSSQKSGYFQHLKQSDQIFSGISVRWTSWNPILSKKSFW
jgi:hypothetical protein